MKACLLVLLCCLSAPALALEPARPPETKLGRFLKTCAWGFGIGAAAGTVSLVFEDKPSEHTINIARGASLGLYGGIIYGLVDAENQARSRQARPEIDDYIGVRPVIEQGRLDGAEAVAAFPLW